MPEVLPTPDAEESRINIWLYLNAKSRSHEVADHFLDAVDEKCRLLATRPELGEARPDLAPNVRQFPVGDYVILYRPVPNGVLVLLMIHGSRDVPAVWKSSRFGING